MRLWNCCIGVLIAGSPAFAAAFPVGTYECREAGRVLTLTLEPAGGAGFPPKIEAVVKGSLDEWHFEGLTMAAERRHATRSFKLLRLPGSTLELYYNDAGDVGLSEGSLNCRKL